MPPPKLSLKRTRSESIVTELQQICLPDCPAYDDDNTRWWVAMYGEHVAGFAGSVDSSVWQDTIYLCRSGVLPYYRGHGLQKKLIRVRLKEARKRGMQWAITDTRDNPASANSLIACGFQMFSPSNPWSFSDSCYWRKRL